MNQRRVYLKVIKKILDILDVIVLAVGQQYIMLRDIVKFPNSKR